MGDQKPDWTKIGEAATESAGFWQRIGSKIKDKGLRDLMNTLNEGKKRSVEARDRMMLDFAAQLQLDAVDLLEKGF